MTRSDSAVRAVEFRACLMLQDEQAATSRKKSKGPVSAAGSLAAAAWFAVAAVAHASRRNLGSCKFAEDVCCVGRVWR